MENLGRHDPALHRVAPYTQCGSALDRLRHADQFENHRRMILVIPLVRPLRTCLRDLACRWLVSHASADAWNLGYK